MKNILSDVLLVEDNLPEKDIIQSTLSHMGLNVMLPRNPTDALRLLDRGFFKLILMDTFEDPTLSIDLVRKIRDRFDTPIIVLLDKQKELTEEQCLKAGADDYVTKPINDQILNLRVKQQITQAKSESMASSQIMNWQDLSLDCETCDFTINGHYVPLTRTEFFLLRCLLSNPERVFTRPQLLNAMNVSEGIGSDHLIDTHLSRLRVKIRENGGGDYIRAVRGIGIKFATPNHQNYEIPNGISNRYQLKEA